MGRLNKVDVQFDNSSYIDPTGRVFYWEEGVYRAFYQEVSPFYREMLSSSVMRGLIEQGKVVETDVENDLAVEGFDLVVRHRRIPFPTYCFEWTSGMLKDAALLTLELAVLMNEAGLGLQDATPNNIFFDLSKPVFIDIGSFVPSGKDYLWAPYQQFCNFFLFPLYLHCCGYNGVARKLLFDTMDGVSADEVASILRLKHKVKSPGYLKRIYISELLSRLFKGFRDRGRMASLSSSLSERVDLQKTRARFLKSLRRDLERMDAAPRGSHWGEYYEQTEKAVLQEKKRAIAAVLEEHRPSTVLDIGCNTGIFSLMAARSGSSVVAFDTDHDSVNRLYGLASGEGLGILPLVMNILAPSPETGWRALEYRGAGERLRCELVLALALLHHMVFTGGQDFNRSVESIKDFQRDMLVIEYVDRSDPMVRLLPRRPNVDYGWYTLENFTDVLSKHFAQVKVLKKLSDTRTLLLASQPQ